MSPLDSHDVERIADAVAKRDSKPPQQTGEQPAAVITEKSKFGWPVVLAAIAAVAFAVTAAGVAQGADKTATKAEAKTQDHEARIVRLEEQRKSDAELLRKVADALEKNAQTLQAVQVELAKRK
jgi:hypothetical protein